MDNKTAKGEFSRRDGERRNMLDRAEQYANWTLPAVFPDDDYDERTDELANDFQSLGAQLVNNLANKMMLTGFKPSQPFFRIELPADTAKPLNAAAAQGDENALQVLAAINEAERKAIKVMDSYAIRPVLYELIKHLIITGNALLELGDGFVLCHSMRDYVCSRSAKGKMMELILRESVALCEFDDKTLKFLADNGQRTDDMSEEVEYFTWCRWDGKLKKYHVTFWVGDLELAWTAGHYAESEMPYHSLTWTLPAKQHYGIGLVEEYAGDFGALSMLSEAQIKAAILASEFRFLINPAGQTSVLDFKNTENGDAIPGSKDDIAILEATGGAQRVQAVQSLAAEYIQRLGRAFLLSTAVTRDSERTTAAEIRMQINELETSLGGAYTRMAVGLQKPVAYWLLRAVQKAGNISDLDIIIVTGLDALSRSGDLENLNYFFQNLAALASLPPEVKARLNYQRAMSDIAAGCGVSASDYMLPEQQAEQNLQAYQQQMADQSAPQAQPQQGAMNG